MEASFIETERKLKAFYELKNIFEQSSDLGKFSQYIVALIVETLGALGCTLNLASQGEIIRLSGIGAEVNDFKFFQIEKNLLKLAIKGKKKTTKKLSKQEYYLCFPFLVNLEHERAAFLSEVAGGLVIFSRCPLRESDESFVNSIVSLITSVIVSHKCKEELSWKTTEFLSLVEIGKAISSVLDVDELLNLAVHTAAQLVRSDSAALTFFNGEDKKFKVKASLGISSDQLSSMYKKDESFIKYVAQTNQPLFVADTSKDEYFKNLRRGKKRIKSLIAVPIKRKNNLLGVLSVDIVDSQRQFVAEDIDLLSILAGQLAVSVENATLYEQLHNLFISTIQSLALTLEAKDKYTRGHSERVTTYAVKVAKLLNLSQETVEAIRHASILHDIGKIGLKGDILRKTASLNAKERHLVEMHPKISAEILRPITFLKDVIPIVYHHHERYDGKGYLDKLKGKDIPIGARILAVVDAYEAMISNRPYRRQLSKEEALVQLENGAGKQFDPEIVKAFVSIIKTGTKG